MNLKYFAVVLLKVAILLFLIHCEKRFIDQVQAFYGNVTDSTTGLAIDCAWIDNIDGLPPYNIYSDSFGNYRAEVIGSDEVDIYCGKEGYLTNQRILRFGGANIKLDFKLVRR